MARRDDSRFRPWMRHRPLILALAGAAGAATAVWLWAEAVHARASVGQLGSGMRPAGSEAIVVLGYRNRGRRANALNRYRVRAGLRSRHLDADESVLVLCGGGVAGNVPEAELMARYARERGYTGPIRLDTASATTWENIRNAVPLIEDADTIMIVSNSLHAEKGRAYLWRQRPDLAERLVPAQDYRFGEIALIKPFAAVLGLRRLAVAAPGTGGWDRPDDEARMTEPAG